MFKNASHTPSFKVIVSCYKPSSFFELILKVYTRGVPNRTAIFQDSAHQSFICCLFYLLWTSVKISSPEAKGPVHLSAALWFYLVHNDISHKLNEYFATIAQRLCQNKTTSNTVDFENISRFVDENVPQDSIFQIPLITPAEVSSFIGNLDPSKSTGLDGIGPKNPQTALQCYFTEYCISHQQKHNLWQISE